MFIHTYEQFTYACVHKKMYLYSQGSVYTGTIFKPNSTFLHLLSLYYPSVFGLSKSAAF